MSQAPTLDPLNGTLTIRHQDGRITWVDVFVIKAAQIGDSKRWRFLLGSDGQPQTVADQSCYDGYWGIAN